MRRRAISQEAIDAALEALVQADRRVSTQPKTPEHGMDLMLDAAYYIGQAKRLLKGWDLV